MNHETIALLHHIAAKPRGYALVHEPDLCAAIPRARELRLVESPSDDPLDMFHLSLTALGVSVVSEQLNIGLEALCKS